MSPPASCSSLPHVPTVSRVQRCIITRNNFQLTFSTCNKIQKLCALHITNNHSASSGPRANHRIYRSTWRHSTRTGHRAPARISQGKGGLDLRLSTARAHPPPLPNLSPSTSRSSLYFHTHISVYKPWWHGRRPYTARSLYISPLHMWQEAVGTYSITTTPSRWPNPGFYHRSRRTINYTDLHMTSGYLLLRHYQKPVEPNLQRHPYTTIGAVPYTTHG